MTAERHERLTVDPSHVVILPTELEEGPKQFPAALMRWSSPEECADELVSVFGRTWARMLAVALRERIRGGGV